MSGSCYREKCDDPSCQVCGMDRRLGLTQPVFKDEPELDLERRVSKRAAKRDGR